MKFTRVFSVMLVVASATLVESPSEIEINDVAVNTTTALLPVLPDI